MIPSLPHSCTCSVCGRLMDWRPNVMDLIDAETQRKAGMQLLAGAIIKLAPEASQEIARRFEQLLKNERAALDEFVAFLRKGTKEEET
jgi:hypothetical protein